MSINATVDGTTYSGIDTITVGGKSLALTSDGWTTDGIANRTEPNGAVRVSGTTLGGYCFSGCGGITSITAPNVTSMGFSCAINCSALTVVDVKTFTGNYNAFQNCSNLNTIIIRNSTAVDLSQTSSFVNTPFGSGGSGGTIYVPQSLLSTYPSLTNWSTIDGYGTITWTAIEGSQYENYYADGTAVS